MGDATPTGRDLLAAYRAARTPTEYYAARIPILLRALPEEVIELAEDPVDGRRRLPPAEARWLRGLADMVRRAGPTVRLRASSPAPDVRVLSGPDADGGRGVIALFTGAAGRLNLPLPVVLQHLPTAGRELVLLSDPVRHAYLSGVPGVAGSLPALAEWLREHAAGRPLWTVGTSMGGGPAVIAGLLAGAVRAAAVGGSDPLRRPDAGSAAAEVGRLLVDRRAATGTGSTEVLCVHAEGNPRDAAGAAALIEAVGEGRTVVLSGTGRHNVLDEALRSGVLRDLLELLVDPDTPVPPGGGAITIPCRHPAPGPVAAWRGPRPGPRPRRRDRLGRMLAGGLPRDGGLHRALVAALYRRDVVAG